MKQVFLNDNKDTCSISMKNYVSTVINKLNFDEYISNKSVFQEGIKVTEKLTDISAEDENSVIKYLLEIMRKHGIITEREYQKVLYKYS